VGKTQKLSPPSPLSAPLPCRRRTQVLPVKEKIVKRFKKDNEGVLGERLSLPTLLDRCDSRHLFCLIRAIETSIESPAYGDRVDWATDWRLFVH
jgi:hypothetical protein